MKKFVLPAVTLLASLLAAQAQTFAPTNLAVLRIGGTGQSLASTGNTINIDQYTTAGALLNSVTVPDTGANALITGAGGSATEGFMSLSADSRYIVLNGYNTNRGSVATTLSGTAGSNVWRGVATIDGYGTYALQFASNVESATSIRGAASDGLSNYWLEGGNTGIIYVGKNGPVATLTGTTANERCLSIINGNLWFSTGSGTHGVYMVTGLPKSGAATQTLELGNSASSVEGFTVNPSLGIAYSCDDDNATAGGGITRYSLSNSLWISNYTIPFATGGAYAVVADWTQTPPVLYATLGGTSVAAANTLVTLTDTGSNATSTVIATAPAGQAFRGLIWAPAAGGSVTNQPSPVLVDAGQTAVFSAGVAGTAPLSLQWYSNSVANTNYVAIPGATSATLTLPNTTTDQSGSLVYIVVSNVYGVGQSTPVSLTVNPPGPPINIAVTPTALTVNAGASVVFNSSVVGGTPLTYGWTLNGNPLSDGANITGSHSPSLTIAGAFAANAGSYMVLITNSFNTGSSSPSVLTVNDPYIITQPAGASNLLNASGTVLSVFAAGTPTLTYQWLSNSVAIAGAQSSSYTVPGSATPGQSTYSVIVSNGVGLSVTSSSTVVSFSSFLLNEPFNYGNGNLFALPGSSWTDINGTNVEIVTNGRVVVNQTNGTTDGQIPLSQSESGTVMWSSFIINLSTLPTNAGGVYFANFEDTTFNFFGRIFTLTSNAPAQTPGVPNVAFPGTYRLGISGGQGDSTGVATNGPAAVVPIDLAPGIDYRVVFFVDMANLYVEMAINPASITDVMAGGPGGVSSGPATDAFHPTNTAAFGLRQRQGQGVFQLDNILVSFDFNGAGSGYTAISAGIVASNPVIGLQPQGTTNFAGNPYIMEVAASGIGAAGTGLTYAWYHNSAPLSDSGTVSGSSTAALTLTSLAGPDSGTYYAIVTGTGSTQSSNAVVSVNTTPVAPSFTLQPASNTVVGQGSTVIYTASATGTGPITYEWFFNGVDKGVSGSTLNLSNLGTNQSGTYYVVATGGTGLHTQSSNALLTVTGPITTNIHYLRSLIDPSTFNISDTSSLYTITGVVTVGTNLTSGTTSSYYLQDATGGINLFITGTTAFRPAYGDIVTATGVLSSFGDNLELALNVNNTAQVYADLSPPSGTVPAPVLLSWETASINPASTVPTTEGSIITMTNVYFVSNTASSGAMFTNSITAYPITNNTGEKFSVFVSAQQTNFNGLTIPAFASSLTGVLEQTTATNYSIIVSRYSDIVPGTPPSTVTITNVTGTVSGGSITLKWSAVPSVPYSVQYSTNVAGPYTTLLATNLTFAGTIGTYTDTVRTTPANFYEISSP